MDPSQNDSLQPESPNSIPPLINSQEEHKEEGMATFFEEFANDNNDVNTENPDDDKIIQAIAQESESFIPRENEVNVMDVRVNDKEDQNNELSKKASSDKKSNDSGSSRLKDADKDNEVEEEMQIMSEKPIEIAEEPESFIPHINEGHSEMNGVENNQGDNNNNQLSKKSCSDEQSYHSTSSRLKKSKDVNQDHEVEEEMQIMKEKPVVIEKFEECELPPEFLNFEDLKNDAPTMLTKAKELDNLREIGPDGKFVISNKTLKIQEKKNRYEEIIYYYKSDLDIACLVCLDGEAYEEDEVFLCDLCNSAFHQSCFGSELLGLDLDVTNLGDWFCHRCAYLLENDLPFTGVRCEFCPELKGPMKRINQKSDKYWGHITCVNWIPEIYYEDIDEKENVYITNYWKDLSCGRKELLCCFCGIQYGDCIGCDSKLTECQTKFHVTCAQLHGLIANWQDMENAKRADDTEYFMPIYCKSHMAKEFSEEKCAFAKQVEQKNLQQFERISHMYHLPTDLEDNRKPRSLEIVHKKKPRRREKDRVHESQKRSTGIRVKKESLDSERNTRRLRRNSQRESPPPEERNSGVKEMYIVKNKDEFSTQLEKAGYKKARKNGSFFNNEDEPSSPGVFTARPATKSVLKEKPQPKSKKDLKKSIKKESGEVAVTVPVAVVQAEEEKKPEKLYKFKPSLAGIMDFSEWVSEKEIKRKIQTYLVSHKLYNKEKELIEIYKNEDLLKLMNVQTLGRHELFEKFKEFLHEKNAGEGDTLICGEGSYYAEYQKAVLKAREEEKAKKMEMEKEKEPAKPSDKKVNSQQSKPEAKSQLETTLSSRYLPHSTPSTASSQLSNVNYKSLSKPFVSPAQKTPNSTTTKPLLKQIKNPTENIPSLNSKREGASMFDTLKKGEEVYVPKKLKTTTLEDTSSERGQTSSILNSLLRDPLSTKDKEKPETSSSFGGLLGLVKADYMPFRKGMKWFNQTFDFTDFESVNDPEVLAVLWPKGADMLF